MLLREENQLADYLSKVIDYDDWSINTHVFAWVDVIWGPHTGDRFANRQTERFNSRFWMWALRKLMPLQ